MTIKRKLALEYESDIKRDIEDRDSTVDTTIGPVRDLVARPVSRVADELNRDIVRISEIQSLTNVEQFENEELDDFAFNSQIVRGPGSRATTIVSLISSSPPTADVTIPINFPFSTDPESSTGEVIFFRATEQVQYFAVTATAYYDAIDRVYRLEVPVESVSTGSNTNVGPGRIVKAQRSIGGFQRVTNKVAAQGGSDSESNTSLADTLLTFALGINDISTPFGTILETKRRFPAVVDQEIVYGSDPLLTRASADSGATDVYILGQTSATYVDNFIYNGSDMVLLKQPIISVSSVISGINTFIEGTHYSVIKDSGFYGGSIRGQDLVRFLPTSPLFPAIGDTVTVTYTYNQLISELQSFFTTEEFYVIGRDLLYKSGFQMDVEVEGTLFVLPNFDPAVVRTNVVSAIYNYINSLYLGANLEQFDLITEIGTKVGQLGGVDNFILSKLCLLGGSGVNDITVEKSEYVKITTTDIVVSLAV